MKREVPEWLLERLAHGDLPAAEAEKVRARLAAEPDGEARLKALRASDTEILGKLPPAAVAAEVKRRHAAAVRAAPARRGFAFAVPLFALGATALVALFAVPRAEVAPSQEDAPEITREKGLRPQLVVYRKHGADAERLGAGAGVKAGDLLQLAYVSAGRRFGVIASVDARGTVTPHLPALPGAATALAARGETRLPHSYELDASPGFERFVFVTADEPFATEVVTRALEPGAAPLPPGFATVEITLRKETP